MSTCTCQFCIDYKRFKEVLPTIPAEHREWFESVFDGRWNAEEELSYKKAILDGTWPDSVEILSHHLANAIKRNEPVEHPDYVHSCDVVDISDGPCGDPSHDEPEAPGMFELVAGDDCPECKGSLVERLNSATRKTFLGCSAFPKCRFSKSGGSNPVKEVELSTDHFDYDYCADADDGFLGGDHQGDFF